MHGFCQQLPIVQENATKPTVWEKLENWYSYLSYIMDAFFPFDFHPTVYFSIWKIHGFCHEFPMARENATKPIA